jgi:murein DD-endopeptidase MepM/ murein hydrolase activator NlpD
VLVQTAEGTRALPLDRVRDVTFLEEFRAAGVEEELRNRLTLRVERSSSPSQIGVVSAQLEPLERDLQLHKEKLARLNELFRLQTSRYHFYRSEYSALIDRLGNRLVDLYEQGEPSSLEVLFAAKSFDDLVDQAQVVDSLATQDKSIAGQVGTARERVRVQREHTKKFRALVAAELRTIAVRTNQVRALRDRLLANENRLAAARANKRGALQDVKESKSAFLHEAEGLQQASSDLAAQIRSAQSTSSFSAPGDTTPSAAGFIWPVNGPVTSGFGWRWGRLHEGIDIGVGYGTPIRAAAAGRVALGTVASASASTAVLAAEAAASASAPRSAAANASAVA